MNKYCKQRNIYDNENPIIIPVHIDIFFAKHAKVHYYFFQTALNNFIFII